MAALEKHQATLQGCTRHTSENKHVNTRYKCWPGHSDTGSSCPPDVMCGSPDPHVTVCGARVPREVARLRGGHRSGPAPGGGHPKEAAPPAARSIRGQSWCRTNYGHTHLDGSQSRGGVGGGGEESQLHTHVGHSSKDKIRAMGKLVVSGHRVPRKGHEGPVWGWELPCLECINVEILEVTSL